MRLLPIFAAILLIFSCRTNKSPAPTAQQKAGLSVPIIETFDFNLFFKGKSKLSKDGEKLSASFEVNINSESFLINFLGPFGGIHYQLYADNEIISLIDYRELLAEKYPNQSQSRIKLTGTDFSFNELITVFTGRIIKADIDKWKIETTGDNFFNKLVYVSDAVPDEKIETSVIFDTYKPYEELQFPAKISVHDPRFNFSALFVRTEMSLTKKQTISFPKLPEDFAYIDHARILNTGNVN